MLEPGRDPVSVRYAEATPALCVFELIYFARPDSYMEGVNLYEARRHMGMRLAAEHPVGGRPGDARPGHGCAGRRRVCRGIRDPVPGGTGSKPVLRANVHPAVAGDAPARRQRQAEPAARGGARPEADRRGRFDRARQHHQADRGAAAPGRGSRGPRPDQRAAYLPPLLLRDRHGHRDRADRRAALGGGDPGVHRRGDTLGYLSVPGVLAALDLPYDRFCFACFDGNYPEPVPYDASERKLMLEMVAPAS